MSVKLEADGRLYMARFVPIRMTDQVKQALLCIAAVRGSGDTTQLFLWSPRTQSLTKLRAAKCRERKKKYNSDRR